MAEFKEVASGFNRMCDFYNKPPCLGCPMEVYGIDKDTCRSKLLDNPLVYENRIMDWLEEHAELYPYIFDVLQDVFGMPKGLSPMDIWEWINTIRIPSAIAEKLGIQPKEDT